MVSVAQAILSAVCIFVLRVQQTNGKKSYLLSWRKVLFSQASVCPQEKGVGTSHVSRDRSHSKVPLSPLDIRSGELLQY